MPSIDYVLLYCATCGEQRKIAPEKAYEPRKHGDLEWSQFRDLRCPISTCTGTMKRAPEYQEPTIMQGFVPTGGDVAWMS